RPRSRSLFDDPIVEPIAASPSEARAPSMPAAVPAEKPRFDRPSPPIFATPPSIAKHEPPPLLQETAPASPSPLGPALPFKPPGASSPARAPRETPPPARRKIRAEFERTQDPQPSPLAKSLPFAPVAKSAPNEPPASPPERK